MTKLSVRRRLFLCLAVVLFPAISLRTADAQEKQAQQKQTKGKQGVVAQYQFQALAFSPDGEVLFANYASPIGATLVSVGGTLRSQLSLPADRGAVVTRVREKGPADNAGLKLDDIVLTAAGKKVKLDVLREGKRTSVEIRIPGSAVTVALRYLEGLGGIGHYIGVSVVPVDQTLRSHLNLDKGQGVVVTNVMKDSPAAKAGFLKHDVLLSAGETSLGKLDDLHKVVTASAGKSLSIKLLRSGKRQTLNVTPEKRPVAVDHKGQLILHPASGGSIIKFWIPVDGRLLRSGAGDGSIKNWNPVYSRWLQQLTVRHPAVSTTGRRLSLSKVGVEEKLDRMIKQIEQLQKSLEELRKSLPNKPAKSSVDPSPKK